MIWLKRSLPTIRTLSERCMRGTINFTRLMGVDAAINRDMGKLTGFHQFLNYPTVTLVLSVSAQRSTMQFLKPLIQLLYMLIPPTRMAHVTH